MLNSSIKPYITSTVLFNLSVARARKPVKFRRRPVASWLSSAPSKLMIEGKSVKATSKAVTTPIIIIQPNVIIGKIPLTTREPNATRVVSAV